MRLLLTIVDRFATALFVNCEAIADYLVENWHVPRKRIEVCYNGFEPSEFHPHGRSRPHNLSGASLIIGTVAVLREEKKLSTLIEAFKAVLSQDPRARLLIVGDGAEKDALQQQARLLGIADACIFEAATKEPAKWMRAIDVFVLTSNSEAFPNSLLEAMACGCCVVSSRVGGTPELIKDGENGFLFQPSDTGHLAELLCTLTASADLRLKTARAGVAFTQQRLTIEIAAMRLASIYKKLLGQRVEASSQTR